jgi:hypothetical protein
MKELFKIHYFLLTIIVLVINYTIFLALFTYFTEIINILTFIKPALIVTPTILIILARSIKQISIVSVVVFILTGILTSFCLFDSVITALFSTEVLGYEFKALIVSTLYYYFIYAFLPLVLINIFSVRYFKSKLVLNHKD